MISSLSQRTSSLCSVGADASEGLRLVVGLGESVIRLAPRSYHIRLGHCFHWIIDLTLVIDRCLGEGLRLTQMTMLVRHDESKSGVVDL